MLKNCLSWKPLLFSLVLLSCSNDVDFKEGPDGQRTIGEMTHAVALTNARAEPVCSAELESVLIEDRDLFVSGVDDILNEPVLAALPKLLEGSVLPSFDDGNLEKLVDAVSDSMSLLVDDGFDPDRKTLQAFVDLSQNHKILQDIHGTEILRTLIVDPNLSPGIQALAGLAETTDRQGTALGSLLSGVSGLLETTVSQSTCTGLSDQKYAERLLATENFSTAAVQGAPAWVARVDSHGNPVVQVDSATGTLFAPFMDADNDGEADVNEAGEPVDANGQVISIAAFGHGSDYDDQKRRMVGEAFLFDYYNVKQTAVAHGLRIVGEAIQQGFVAKAALGFSAAMGTQVPCDDGENCFHYEKQGNSVYQLAFSVLEMAKYPQPVELLETWTDVVQNNPELAERILVAAGQILTTVGASDIDGADPELYELVSKLLPTIAEIFRLKSNSGVAMPRLLMELMHDLGTTARDFPTKLLLSTEHYLDSQNQWVKVDFTKKRYYTQNGTENDNRSSLEKSIELFSKADCGNVLFTGRSLTHYLINLLADMNPNTVKNLITTVIGAVNGGGLGKIAVDGFLLLVGCNGDVSYTDVLALDDLARGGALDFYLPVASVFKAQGEIDGALMKIFHTIAADLQAGDAANSTSKSALRPMLPVISDVLRSGAMDPFFDLNDLMVTVPAKNGNGTMADIVIDSQARLLDDRGTIQTANGPKFGVSLAEDFLDGLQKTVTSVKQSGGQQAFADVASYLASAITKTRVDGKGKTRLEDRSVVPLLGTVLDALAQAAQLPTADLECYLTHWQQQVGDFMVSPELAALVRVGILLGDYQDTKIFDAFIGGMLDPNPLNQDTTTYPELLRVTAEVLQNPEPIQGVSEILNFVSAVVDPKRSGTNLITTIDHVVANDSEQILWTVAGNAFGPMGTESSNSPIQRLIGVYDHVDSVDVENTCGIVEPGVLTVAELEETVHGAIEFMQEEDSLLSLVFQVFRERS